MPIPVGAGVRPAPPPPRPPARPRERQQVTWHAPDGTVWPLTTPRLGWRTLAATNHQSTVPQVLTSDDNPRGGVHLRHSQPQGRQLIWPILVHGSSHQQFITRWWQLEDAFTQTLDLGPGVLRVVRPDGTAREIAAVYEAGWDQQPRQGWLYDHVVLSLLCEDPHWRDPQPVTVRRSWSEAQDFYDPYASISSGQVLGDTTVHNPGRVDAWPTWQLTGPLTSLTAVNHTTGQQFEFDPGWDDDGPLAAGETATIVTDPIQVRGPTGQVWTGAINLRGGGTLWPLRRGVNQISFTAAGAAEGTTVQLQFHPRFRTA